MGKALSIMLISAGTLLSAVDGILMNGARYEVNMDTDSEPYVMAECVISRDKMSEGLRNLKEVDLNAVLDAIVLKCKEETVAPRWSFDLKSEFLPLHHVLENLDQDRFAFYKANIVALLEKCGELVSDPQRVFFDLKDSFCKAEHLTFNTEFDQERSPVISRTSLGA